MTRTALGFILALATLSTTDALARENAQTPQRELGVSATVLGRCIIGTRDLAQRGASRIEGSIALGCVQGTIAAVKVALAGVATKVGEAAQIGIAARESAEDTACNDGTHASVTAERARSNATRHYALCGTAGTSAQVVTATILF